MIELSKNGKKPFSVTFVKLFRFLSHYGSTLNACWINTNNPDLYEILRLIKQSRYAKATCADNYIVIDSNDCYTSRYVLAYLLGVTQTQIKQLINFVDIEATYYCGTLRLSVIFK